jgi:hypothetical protein
MKISNAIFRVDRLLRAPLEFPKFLKSKGQPELLPVHADDDDEVIPGLHDEAGPGLRAAQSG